MATTQAVIGALKSAGFVMSKLETVRTSRPCSVGEIITTAKRYTNGFAICEVPRTRIVVVEYRGADRDAFLEKGMAALRAKGFIVKPPKLPGMAASAE